jgi:succinate dehydrogenase / fumarate reductase cytochrome b subunit
MSQLARLLASSIGRKIVMAITGLALIGFLVVHLAGNLLIFVGADAFNDYSHHLISNPLIYVAEAGLLVLFVSHFLSGFSVTLQSRAARPVPYVVKRRARHTSNKSIASSTMIFSGLLLLVFVPLHLWTFKFGPWYQTTSGPPERDLHRLVLEVFHNPLHVAWYEVAMVVIGFHLWQGFGSAFETLGIGHRSAIRRTGEAFAVLLMAGFAVIPLAILFGGVRP